MEYAWKDLLFGLGKSTVLSSLVLYSLVSFLLVLSAVCQVQLVDIGDLRERISSQAAFVTTESEQQNLDVDFYKYSSPESSGKSINDFIISVLIFETIPFISKI